MVVLMGNIFLASIYTSPQQLWLYKKATEISVAFELISQF